MLFPCSFACKQWWVLPYVHRACMCPYLYFCTCHYSPMCCCLPWPCRQFDMQCSCIMGCCMLIHACMLACCVHLAWSSCSLQSQNLQHFFAIALALHFLFKSHKILNITIIWCTLIYYEQNQRQKERWKSKLPKISPIWFKYNIKKEKLKYKLKKYFLKFRLYSERHDHGIRLAWFGGSRHDHVGDPQIKRVGSPWSCRSL